MLDKSVFEFIGSYYTRPKRAEYVPGQICDGTVYYLPRGSLSVLRFDIEAANRGEDITYRIGAIDDNTFDHRPVAGLRPLERHEAFAVVTTKRRPIVVVSSPVTFPNVAGLNTQDFREVFMACPIFSFRESHPLEFRLRLQAWEYNMLFHLPRDDRFEVEEGFLRFDRCLIIPKGQLRLRPVALSDNALYAMQNCVTWFMTGKLEETFEKYRHGLLELLSRRLGHDGAP